MLCDMIYPSFIFMLSIYFTSDSSISYRDDTCSDFKGSEEYIELLSSLVRENLLGNIVTTASRYLVES